MYLYSTTFNDNWHFFTELGSNSAWGWAPPSKCASEGPYHSWNSSTFKQKSATFALAFKVCKSKLYEQESF